ncbi:RNA-binding Prp24, putative [Babesia caballi]|uniref:RNA-binding Prp24, putative n=1 Tax=Babesia caballi TaxID=5871 RepID=A0AAV4LS04_BABCB|nr:RNA-binding Prp24, putative [Babesia caballi]
MALRKQPSDALPGLGGAGGRPKKGKTRATSESRPTALLPAFPLPAPELCLLNARPLSCLYGDSHERSHRKRVRRALADAEVTATRSDPDGSESGSQCADGDEIGDGRGDVSGAVSDSGDSDDEPVAWEAKPSEIKEDLRVCEALLSYIGVRLASKRNAMAILGIDMGSLDKGFGLLKRASQQGVALLPLRALVKTLQTLRSGRNAVEPSESHEVLPPTDLSERLEDLGALRREVKALVADALMRVKRRDGNRHGPVGLRDFHQLPLVDSAVMSLLAPSGVVLPDDMLRSHLVGPIGSGSRVGVTASKPAKAPNVLGAQKTITTTKGDKTLGTAGSALRVGTGAGKSGKAAPKPALRVTPRAANPAGKGRDVVDSRSRSGGGSAKASSKRRAPSSEESSAADGDDESDDPVDDDDADDSDYLDSDAGKPPRRTDSAGDRAGERAEASKDAPIPESELSEEQMLQNLLNGKLCDGSEPKNARELVISILVAGLYEFLPVEFFNEFLQDRRLSECFTQVQAEAAERG